MHVVRMQWYIADLSAQILRAGGGYCNNVGDRDCGEHGKHSLLVSIH
jgi:hypothetical protein